LMKEKAGLGRGIAVRAWLPARGLAGRFAEPRVRRWRSIGLAG
jgi:hypothetical protein